MTMENHMTKLTLALLSTSALMLAACGGGSDNNAPQDQHKPAPQQPNNPGTNTPPPQGTYQGQIAIVPTGTTITASTPLKSTASNNLGIVNADGKQIAAQIPGFVSGNLTILSGSNINGKSYKTFIVSGYKYPNSKFGYITEGNEDYIFSHGALTTNMPTSGRVKYDGDAIIARAGITTTGDADFVADFGAKTLTGKIDDSKGFAFNPVHIHATISGNSFITGAGPVNAGGNFYGPNAAELGGVFNDASQELSGSFGAKIDR